MSTTARNLLIVFLITLGTHALAVSYLPQDFDEPVYVQVAMDYADSLQREEINSVIDYPESREHPALVKLVYGIAALADGNINNYTAVLKSSRVVSAVFGVLATLIVALIDPFAGCLMAVHTLVVKYSSQAYLEAIPLAMSTLSIFAFLKIGRERRGAWLWLSAIALGIATAAKLTYIPVTVVVLCYLAFFEKKIQLKWMMFYSVVAVGVFFAFNVTLWHDPFDRAAESLAFHLNYQRGAHVQEADFPWYQPFNWLFVESPGNWHPSVFFYDVDQFIAFFAFAGIPRECRQRRWLVVWLLSGIVFLLAWGTKWLQYVLTIIPAICLMAAESLRRTWTWFTQLSYYKSV